MATLYSSFAFISYSFNSIHNQSDFAVRENTYLVSSSTSWLMDAWETNANEDMKVDFKFLGSH